MSKTIHPKIILEVVSLEDLFRAIDQGRLRIPDFQRPFVWNAIDMRELFDSVLRGYPIGSLVFWEPEKSIDIKSVLKFGPFDSPPSNAKPTFVIDGFHRLSTLYGVLKSSSIKQKKENWKYNIYLNIQQENVALEHINQRSSSSPTIVPLHSLWNSKEFFEAAEGIKASGIDSSGELLQRLEDVYSNLRGYKLAVTRMTGENNDDVFTLFTRLNSSGRKISKAKNAKTYP